MSATQPSRTALQLAIPEAGHVIEAVARARLPGVRVLRPAHISLGYPWLPPMEAFAQISHLQRALEAARTIPLRMATLRAFEPDARGRRLLHLTVQPTEPVTDLAAQLGAARPFQPHLSVARIAAGADDRPVADLVDPLLPVLAIARTIELRVQYGELWRVEQVFHLGT